MVRKCLKWYDKCGNIIFKFSKIPKNPEKILKIIKKFQIGLENNTNSKQLWEKYF